MSTLLTIGTAVLAVKTALEQLAPVPLTCQASELRGIAFKVLEQVPAGSQAAYLSRDIALDLQFMLETAARRPGSAVFMLLKASCIVEGAALSVA